MAYISTDAMWYSNGTMHDHQTSLPAPVRTGSELSLEVRYGGDLIIGTLSNGPLKLSVLLEILLFVFELLFTLVYIWTVRFGMNVVKSILYLYSFIVDWNTL